MGWILITNDDGMDSPALPPLVRAVGNVAEVRVVVPDRERSWIGKAITRHDPINVLRTERDGFPITATSGYPADCVQLGIHALYPEPPDLVVSGINIGYNHGAGYVHSSGTVGAAIEGLLAGIPSIALSAGSHSRPWDVWRSWVHTPEAAGMWDRLAGIAADLTGRLLPLGPPGVVVNVNLPDDATDATPRVLATIARVGYEQLFREAGDGTYVHDFGGGLRWFAGLEGTDVDVTAGGRIAISPITPFGAGSFPSEVSEALTGIEE